jgi:hypothetical protein
MLLRMRLRDASLRDAPHATTAKPLRGDEVSILSHAPRIGQAMSRMTAGALANGGKLREEVMGFAKSSTHPTTWRLVMG